MIDFKLVSKRFGNKLILDRITFSIRKGEIVFMIGKSGMGKSVTLKCIVGLYKPENGEIWVDNEQVNNMSESQLFGVRRKCGMVFQHPALLDSLNVYENLAFGIRAHRLCRTEKEIRAKVIEKLQLVNLEESILSRYPQQISWGMQKRVSLARTLAVDPEYLLFDEPTTGQDPISKNAINRLILRLSTTLGVTSIVVSHDMDCALEIANRIFMLDKGRLIVEGTPQALLNSPEPLVQDFLKDLELKLFAGGGQRDSSQ